MYGLTRSTTTVLAAAAGGFLLWIATRFSNDLVGGYWAQIGLLAGAGLVMALTRPLSGRMNRGFPRLSIPVLVLAFVPVAVVSLWVIVAGEPGAGWFHNHVLSWTRDIRVSGLVSDTLSYIPVLAFGTGLVLGYSFDTTGPRVRDRQIDTSSSQNLQPSEGASIHERIGAYTLAHAQDQPQAERRSGTDRRQSQVEPFERSSERRATGERRSGINRRGGALEQLSGAQVERRP